MVNFNELDYYKRAIDEGFICISDITFYKCSKTKKYVINIFTTKLNRYINIKEGNWNEFKKQVIAVNKRLELL